MLWVEAMLEFMWTIIATLVFGQTPAAKPEGQPSVVTVSIPETAVATVALVPVPPIYSAWLGEGDNAQRVAMFERELAARGLTGIVPTHEILRTAIDWERCGASPFELPDQSYWRGAFDSLGVIKSDLVPLLGAVEIVSGYRHATLNQCAGGAPSSVHREFGAFDAFATAAPSREEMIAKLCDWHAKRGTPLRAGLGIYQGKKFHIDVGMRGHRHWGSDYRAASSPCA